MWTRACIRTRLGPLAHSMRAPEPLWNDHSTHLLFPSGQQWVLSLITHCWSLIPLALLVVYLHRGAILKGGRGKSIWLEGGKSFLLVFTSSWQTSWLKRRKSFSCLCVSMGAWLCVQTHWLTVKEYCFHYHLLLCDHDREHTGRIHLCEDY